MAWLARLDARVNTWPAIWRGLYLLVKWSLVALGAFCWIMLWWERHPLLGVLQAGCIGYVLLHTLRGE